MDQLSRIRQTLDAARKEINQGNPDVAIQLLRGVHRSIEELGDSLLSVEHKLLTAEALATKADESAASLFQESISEIEKLKATHPELFVRAMENYGNFLVTTARRPSRAKEVYAAARQVAVESGFTDSANGILLRMMRIDLETDKDQTELDNFLLMKRIGKQEGYTSSEQLSVWAQHTGPNQEQLTGLRHARRRNKASEAYFKNLFKAQRDG